MSYAVCVRRSLARSQIPLLLVGSLGFAACGDGSGPDETPGVLRVSASDVDHAASGVTLAGFDVADVTSFRIRVNAGPRVVVDSTFTIGAAGVQHEFRLEPDSYIVLVEAFQSGNVLLFSGAGEATVASADTVDLPIDLDPALGTIEFTIDGSDNASIFTNRTAPLRVVVRNDRGQPVSGVNVGLSVEPAAAGTVVPVGSAETNADGVLEAVFDPAGAETQGQIRLTVDGFPVALAPRQFTVVSPVDVTRSSLTLTNSVRLAADGRSATQITVKIVDAAGVAQPGIPVVIQSSRNVAGGDQRDAITSSQSVTDGAGEFRAALTTNSSSTLAGDALIMVLADGKELAARGTVTFSSVVNTGLVRMRLSRLSVPANGVSTIDITVELFDFGGRPLPNTFVELNTRNNTLFQLTPRTGRTDANGVFRSQIASLVPTDTFVEVIADGLITSARQVVVFTP